MKRNTRILTSLAALVGLTLMPALGGLNDAQAKNKGKKGRHDNGKHLGWSKGKHKGWSKSSKTWDRDDWDDRRDRRTSTRRSTRRTAWTRPTTRTAWTRSTQTRGRLVGTHYYSSQAAAAAGMRFAQSKGYRATSTYSGPGRWIVRVFTR